MEGEIGISIDEESKKIMAGFKINKLVLKNYENKKEFWSTTNWDLSKSTRTEIFPKEILSCNVVSRTINFTSAEEIKDFSISQQIWIEEQMVEEMKFDFGFVMPNSTNDWEQVIEADQGNMMSINDINGKAVMDTLFLKKGKLLYRARIKIKYE